MPTNQPARKDEFDPFELDEYRTKEIRHTRSRTRRQTFNLINPKDEKSRKRLRIAIAILLIIIIIIPLAILIIPRVAPSPSPDEETPLVNPTGREASGEYTEDITDPKLQASEQKKLTTVYELIEEQDWEYANALFETIFPAYLTDCGRYDYYRYALTLADNFENFSIPRETAESRMSNYQGKCTEFWYQSNFSRLENPLQNTYTNNMDNNSDIILPETEETPRVEAPSVKPQKPRTSLFLRQLP